MNTYRTPQSLIAMIQRVQSARGRRRAGVFSIEGTRLVERALRAGAPLEAVLVAQRLTRSSDPRQRELFATLDAAGCPITIVPDVVVAELTEGRDLGPILGLVRQPPPILLSALLPASDTNNERQTTSPDNRQFSRPFAAPLFLAAIDIVDPGNVGALTRTAHAAGATGLLTTGASDPFHPRATRISRGSIFKLPVIEYESTVDLLRDLRQHDLALVGTAAREGMPLPTMDWPRHGCVILMGNEADGLPPDIQAVLDYNVTIPMPDGVDSYSVNAAAAIVLYTAAQARVI